MSSRVASLEPTDASFASMRRAAVALDRAALRAQGTAATLNPAGPSEWTAKAALTRALGRQADYARALESVGGPTTLTPAASTAIANRAAATHDAYAELARVTGPPCCDSMAVGRASVRRLEQLAGQRDKLAVKTFTQKIEGYLAQSSQGDGPRSGVRSRPR